MNDSSAIGEYDNICQFLITIWLNVIFRLIRPIPISILSRPIQNRYIIYLFILFFFILFKFIRFLKYFLRFDEHMSISTYKQKIVSIEKIHIYGIYVPQNKQTPISRKSIINSFTYHRQKHILIYLYILFVYFYIRLPRS